MQTHIQLANELLKFNERYNRYIHCNSVNSTVTCSNNEKSYSILDASYQNVIKNVNAYNILESTNAVSPSQYDSSYNSIIITSQQNNALRNELDNKIKELLKDKDSISQEQVNAQQANIYTGMIMTILASTLLFYVFRKL